MSKNLDKAKGKWVEKFSGVLWAYRITKRIPTGKTPFSLAYGADAIIPLTSACQHSARGKLIGTRTPSNFA